MVEQGDIIYVSLNPTQGHEQRGFRPCVCLSNSLVCKYSNVIIVAPISTTLRNYPLYFSLNGYKTSGKILLDQMRVIDPNARVIDYVETLNKEDTKKILELTKMIFETD